MLAVKTLLFKEIIKKNVTSVSLRSKQQKLGVKVITHYTLKADCSNKEGKIAHTSTKGFCNSIDLSDAGQLICKKSSRD